MAIVLLRTLPVQGLRVPVKADGKPAMGVRVGGAWVRLRLEASNNGAVSTAETTFRVVPPAAGATIRTDRAAYQIGDRIQVCYRLLSPGNFSITYTPAGGASQNIQGGYDGGGAERCFWLRAKPPTGQGRLRLEVLSGNSVVFTAETTFTVVLPPSGAAIWTDRVEYHLGEQIQICYQVPGSGPIRIIDILPNGSSQVAFTGNGSGCISATITPPTGLERLRLEVASGGGWTAAAETSFDVLP